MEEHEIKYAVTVRMFKDDIRVGTQWADVENVARLAAIPRSDQGTAKALLKGEMVDDDDCPILKTGAGMVALKADKEAIREYLESLETEMDLPWKLR